MQLADFTSKAEFYIDNHSICGIIAVNKIYRYYKKGRREFDYDMVQRLVE